MSANLFGLDHLSQYLFGTDGMGFRDLVVIDFHGVEEISQPFRFAITLARRPDFDPVDLDRLIGAPATLAIRTIEGAGFLLRHGIIVEAEQIERTKLAVLYRVVLAPHIETARHRRRCRTFLDRTLEEIVNQVLREAGLGLVGVPPVEPELAPELERFTPVVPVFVWDLRDPHTIARVKHATLRQYVVQYNESDFDFVARLLEEEGLATFFEHGLGRTVMWISDRPGIQSMFAERPPYRVGHDAGLGSDREGIKWLRTSSRQRSSVVTMRDYDWTRAGRALEGQSHRDDNSNTTHFEFPARDQKVRERPCEQPARVRAERFAVERHTATGVANARGLPHGRRIRVAAVDSQVEEHLLVRVETVAVQYVLDGTALDDEPFGLAGRTPRVAGTHTASLVTLPAGVQFRPSMSTPLPRIDGIQTATVTDATGSTSLTTEIHCDEWARVRLRFPWDQREDGFPSSAWVRVSQVWAGAGYGGLLIPRIGQEVLVSYVNGDPDEPLVVGRVYNVRNPLPTNASEEPEISTLKTQSTPGAEGSNELRFQDLAGHEEVYLHAQRNLTEVVRETHSTKVGHHHLRTIGENEDVVIGASRTTSIGQDLTTKVVGDASTNVDGDHYLRVDGDDHTTVHGQRTTDVECDDALGVIGHRSVSVTGDHSFYTLGAFHAVADGGHSFISKGHFRSSVTNDHHFATNKKFSSNAGESHVLHSPDFKIDSERLELVQKESFLARVGNCFIKIADGMITLNDGAGASVSLVGGKLIVNAESSITLASDDITAKASAIQFKSGSAEKEEETFEDEEITATFVFRVHAAEHHLSVWEDTYTLEAVDGSYAHTCDATDDDERHDKDHSDIEFPDVPVGKKYDLKVHHDGKTTVLLSAYEFEG